MKASLKAWSDRVAAAIVGKMADAAAHARVAVTDALRATPDGRPTLAKVRRSRSYAAALARLDELLEVLCGPTLSSRSGLLRDAREELYVEAFERWVPRIPAELLVRPDPAPTESGKARARTLVLHNVELRQELLGVVNPLKARLQSAIALAGSAAGGGSVDPIEAWERSAKDALTRTAVLSLGDAQVAVERSAGLDLLKPEVIDRTPVEIS